MVPAEHEEQAASIEQETGSSQEGDEGQEAAGQDAGQVFAVQARHGQERPQASLCSAG